MKTTVYFIFVFFLMITLRTYTQVHYLDSYNGIPVIAHTNLSADAIAYNQQLIQKMNELGIYGFYAVDLTNTTYNIFINNNLKVFPLQIGWYSGVNRFEVVKYTDAVYTIWQAEGKGDSSLGDAQIDFNPQIGELSQDGKSVITIGGAPAGTLIYGPYYYQYIYYKMGKPELQYKIDYTAKYELKIDRYIPEELPVGYEDMEVCTLRVTASNLASEFDVIEPIVLKVSDFLTRTGWGVWTDFYTPVYNLMNLKYLTENEIKIPSPIESTEYTSEFMQYKVEWNGLSFLRLSVDSIFISDDKGRDLFTDTTFTRPSIRTTISQFSDEEHVLGWHGLGEPFSIDNYLPFREMNNLVKEVNPQLRVFTSFTSGPYGRYTWHGFYKGVNSPDICPSYEFYKRAGLDYISINLYNYDYPFVPTPSPNYVYDPDYYKLNVAYVTDSTLAKFNVPERDIPFSYSTQSGRFYDYDKDCDNTWPFSINPTTSQMNYHINLGLLFGARELTVDPLFTRYNIYVCDGQEVSKIYREGLIGDIQNMTTLSYLGEFFKDVVKPRLSGLFGKTLKQVVQDTQFVNLNLANILPESYNNINHNKLKYVIAPENLITTIYNIDVGYFNHPINSNIDYFMIVNRYYSEGEDLKLGLQNLSGFNNWTLLNHIDTTSVSFIKDGNDCAEITDVIPQGDGILYGLAPTILLGGELNANESISGTNKLTGELKIKSGKTLTVNGTYNCEKNLIVESGGNLVISPGATLNFHNGAKLIVHGSITAIGTSNSMIDFNFQSVAENSQNGIYLNAGSLDTLVYCVIQNGYFGIKVSSSEPFINYCEIKNCTDGIYFYDSHYQPDMDEGTRVYNSNIHSNYSTGINLLESSPLLMGNNITGNYVGIKCLSSSSPFLGKPFDYGFNLVTGEYAALESDASSPVLGDDELMIGGLNSVYNDIGDYDVIASNESYIAAQNCWWGEYEPDKEDFELLDRSELFYDPALEYDPLQSNAPLRIIEPLVYQSDGGTLPEDVIPMSPVENSVNKQYKQALQKYINGQYAAGKEFM